MLIAQVARPDSVSVRPAQFSSAVCALPRLCSPGRPCEDCAVFRIELDAQDAKFGFVSLRFAQRSSGLSALLSLFFSSLSRLSSFSFHPPWLYLLLASAFLYGFVQCIASQTFSELGLQTPDLRVVGFKKLSPERTERAAQDAQPGFVAVRLAQLGHSEHIAQGAQRGFDSVRLAQPWAH